MIPWGRRVHLHKQASFKTIFENIIKVIGMYLKQNPKLSNKSFKIIKQMMWKNIETHHPQYAKLSNVSSDLGASCIRLLRGSAFFSRPVFRNLWGYPLGTPLDRCEPLGHTWPDFVTFLEDLGSKLAPQFKDSRATNVTNHNFKKTSTISNFFADNQSKQINCTFVV